MKGRLCVKKREIRRCGMTLLLALYMTAGCVQGEGLSASSENLTARYGMRTVSTEEVDAAGLSEEYQTAYADFSLKLLQANMEDDSENVMISPLSVLMALEMTRCGASRETLSQMDEVLYGGLLGADGKRGTQLFSVLCTEKEPLSMANSLWLRTGDGYFTPDEDFLQKAWEDYGAEIYGAPFDKSTVRDINRWVERGTDGMVKEILDEIPGNALMYLVNAVAFDGEWQHPYESYQVGNRTFYSADGSENDVDMMYGTESRYLSGEGVHGFCKYYKDGYSFVALLPDEGITLEEYLSGLDGAAFLQTIREWDDTMVETGLPKFEGETSLDLSDVLRSMGMPAAFDELAADFDRMGYVADGSSLYISRVLHKTYIKVDELGTEAAAATVVEAKSGSAAVMDVKTVILDRPFAYAIVEDETGLPVFVGVVEQL